MQPRDKAAAFLLLAATAALAVALTANPAAAQDPGTYAYDNGYVRPAPGPEEVIVTAPRFTEERGPLGGNLISVSLSREVRIDDLDLRSPWGRHELRSRIRVTAAEVCGQLTRNYPVGVSGSPPCYEQAVARSMHLADDAIRDAYYRY